MDYIECENCNCVDFSVRVLFAKDEKREKIQVLQNEGDTVICDKCKTQYNFYDMISYRETIRQK